MKDLIKILFSGMIGENTVNTYPQLIRCGIGCQFIYLNHSNTTCLHSLCIHIHDKCLLAKLKHIMLDDLLWIKCGCIVVNSWGITNTHNKKKHTHTDTFTHTYVWYINVISWSAWTFVCYWWLCRHFNTLHIVTAVTTLDTPNPPTRCLLPASAEVA